MNRILIIITTEPNIQNANKISNLLLDKKIAACISLKEISSTYFWKGEIETNNEIEITIKSIVKNKDLIINLIKSESSNDLPQIIFKEFESDLNYFNWVKSNIN